MATSTSKPDKNKLDAVHKEFERLGLRGYWQNRREAEPLAPHLWRWADIHPVLMQAADAVAIGNGEEGTTFRRNIGAGVPGQGLGSVSMGFQVVMPSETAPVHHHTATAMRFGVDRDSLPPVDALRRHRPAARGDTADRGGRCHAPASPGARDIDNERVIVAILCCLLPTLEEVRRRALSRFDRRVFFGWMKT